MRKKKNLKFANPSEGAVQGACVLFSGEHWERRFESSSGHGYMSALFCFVLSCVGTDLLMGRFTRPRKPAKMWLRLFVFILPNTHWDGIAFIKEIGAAIKWRATCPVYFILLYLITLIELNSSWRLQTTVSIMKFSLPWVQIFFSAPWFRIRLMYIIRFFL
jgi:hypothetical protein